MRPLPRVLRALTAAASLVVLMALVGCQADARRASGSATPTAPVPTRSVEPGEAPAPVRPSGEPVVIASNLDAPWSILRLPNDGGTLISERDTTRVQELLPNGNLRTAGSIGDARPGGEGGLLGLTFLPDTDAPAGAGWVYAYFTADDDNRIIRMPLQGAEGGYTLGSAEFVFGGIPKAGNHDGGRIAFGPDGLLYATAGDAGNSDAAQDRDALGGKILRMTPTGGVPGGNRFGTVVYSYGHRNPQGIAWDSLDRLWASEFGQNTWDELNLIEPGKNYGWPIVEGAAGDPDFIDPVQQWRTDVASPSGIAIVNDTVFMASLRGERIWRIVPSTGAVDEWFVHDYGRVRDVVAGPDGTLWFVSNNTDGRGSPAAGDDRLYQVEVAP